MMSGKEATRLRIGIDLGGTKIEAIALDEQGQEQARERIATPRNYDGSIRALVELVERVIQSVTNGADADIRVGVGTPGSLSPATGLMRNANSVWLNERPLGRDFAAALGHPVRFANDADCFAMSEAADGAARDVDSVFGVIIGTGVGGGLVYKGNLVQGANGVAGEWGHIPLPGRIDQPALQCWCGRQNCVETWLSGPALARDHNQATGTDVTARDVVVSAKAGDTQAQATMQRYCDRMGRALGIIINVFDPAVIVLGGGVSNADILYEALPKSVLPHIFSDVVRTRIVQNLHGDSSGVRGAAWLWPAQRGAND